MQVFYCADICVWVYIVYCVCEVDFSISFTLDIYFFLLPPCIISLCNARRVNGRTGGGVLEIVFILACVQSPPRLRHSHSRTLFSSSLPVSLAHHPHALNSTGEESNAMEKSELIHFLYCSGIVFFSCCCCFIIACNRHKYIVLVSYVYIKHIKYKYKFIYIYMYAILCVRINWFDFVFLLCYRLVLFRSMHKGFKHDWAQKKPEDNVHTRYNPNKMDFT